MKKNISLLLTLTLIISLGHLSCSKHHKSPYCSKKTIKMSCRQIQKEVLYYWPLDSLGDNGFRTVTADALVRCKCYVGFTWEEVEKKLGKPNFDESIGNDDRIKFYTLSPEYQYIVVYVNEKNIVYQLKIYTRDG